MSDLLSAYIRHMKAAGFSPHTIRGRRRLLEHADLSLPHGVDTPTPDELAEYLADVAAASDSPWTRYTYYSHLAAFYAWASGGRNPYIEWNPIAELMKPQPPDDAPNPVSDDELRIALEQSDDYWRLAVTLGAYAGFRCDDSCRARREDFTEQTIRVRNGKGNKSAILPTHPAIWRLVRERAPGLLLAGKRGQQLTSASMSAAARKHFDKIGLPRVHLHRFRHWYATMLVRQGHDLNLVKELMRHSSVLSTAKYVAIANGQRRLAICTLPVPANSQQEAA